MLKKISIRKIAVATTALFALFLIYMIPKDHPYTLDGNIKKELEYVDKSITTHPVYLLDKYSMLGRTEVVLNHNTVEEKARELLEILIKDGVGESKIPSGFRSLIPSDTKIISIKFEDNVIKVNFSKELLDVNIENEEKVIEAIVYTLTEIKEVDKIILYVDGDVLTKLPKSKTNLPSTLDRRFGINKEFDLKSSKDISQVTVYYINKYNDDYYYVPVTKYANDNREKIKVIIDELTSTPLSHSNLMSFLNSNTKLLAVEQSADDLTLSFNSYIFNDIDKKDILEEVIYTIALSVQDNYEVASVSFLVDNQEIHKSVLKTLE